mmetsp:Transcript_70674/g.184052  ORF Transcript_70674/g.184052 Transcript_70674/m.184052 type:complete len:442 (+) Transcript_70674:1199-2524(+)
MVLVELSDGLVSIRLIARPLVQPCQDAVRDGRGPQAKRDHFLEETKASGHVIRLDATIHQRVVDELVALQAARLDGFRHLQSLVQIPRVAVALQHCRVRDQIWLQVAPCLHHLPQQVLCSRDLVGLDADINDGVVGDGVVRDALRTHLPEELQGILAILFHTIPFDERGVQDGVAVLPPTLHVLEDFDSLCDVAAFHAGIYHAAVRDSIGLPPLLIHVLPNLEDLGNVAGLAICLYQDAQSDVGGVDLQLPHLQHGGLEPRQVLHPAASVEQGIEEHLVGLLGLQLHEGLHQADATVDLLRIPVRAPLRDGLHEHAGDRVLVRGNALGLHLLEGGPGLVHAPAPHHVLEGRGLAASGSLLAAVAVATLVAVAAGRAAASRRRGQARQLLALGIATLASLRLLLRGRLDGSSLSIRLHLLLLDGLRDGGHGYRGRERGAVWC